jgi:hypothetical protein
MKPFTRPLLTLLFLGLYLGSHAQLILAEQKKSDYFIVIPSDPKPDEAKAASVLRDYLIKISGAEIPIVNDEQEAVPKEIVIGRSSRLGQEKVKVLFKEDEEDGFLILTRKEKLFITGGSPEGTLNGVYSFLENYLGCRFYSTEARIIPRMPKVSLPKINDRQAPCFTYREMYFPGRYDTNYRAWHRLDSHSSGSWGMWVHTFDDLVPPQKYFAEHPEYYSEINGVRTPDGQLCISNPEVFRVLTENLRTKMDAQPEAHYWSVSQNDNFLACQCGNCKRIAAEYGGESGLMIKFVNQVAACFPEKVISTLAYQYTRSAPEHIKPLPNVNIMLCTIECNRSKPLADDPSSASFVKDIKDWTKLTDNILIWDYVVQFRNYISPFPNLDVLQPNLKFFADHGCRLMFQQGSGNSESEFVDLRSYMIAKLLWDPDVDPHIIMNDFLYGYYGDAAPFISDYIRMEHEALESSGDNLWIYGYPYSGIDSYLQPVNIKLYKELFDKAEYAVKDDPVILQRTRFARLPLDFAILDISLHNVDEELSWFKNVNGEFKINDELVTLLDTFTTRCNRMDVKMLNEQGLKPDDYRLTIKKFLLKSAEPGLALNKEVKLFTEFSNKYDAGGEMALVDGLRGIDDYHFNWLGFEGDDLEAIVDLGEVQSINQVSLDFIQDIQSWVFLPKSLTVLVSEDGDEFTKIGTVENITPDNKTGAFIQTFAVPANGGKARYIRVRAAALKTCPSWHIGTGSKSWIFTDEIVVK